MKSGHSHSVVLPKTQEERFRQKLLLTLIVAVPFVASLAGFAGVVENPSLAVHAAQGPGPKYVLSFQNSSAQPLTTLPVCTTSECEELLLKAHVEGSNQQPAQRGIVIFQYCSLKGLPPNDITRPDEAPKEACETGSGTWANLASIKVNGSGEALLDFGVVLIPRTVGFRFRYIGQGSGIPNGVSDALNFTWQ